MSRSLFQPAAVTGGAEGDVVTIIVGNPTGAGPESADWAYQTADLETVAGAPIGGGQVKLKAGGMTPRFYGPDGVTTLKVLRNRAVAATLTGIADPLSATGTSVAGVSIPGGWGSVWRAKLAAAPASKPVVACVGTSITRGFYGSNPDTVGYVARLRAALQTAYGDGGSGFRSIGDTAAGTGAWTNYATKPVTLTGTWTQSALTTAHDGPAGCYAVCTTNGGTATFTVRGDTVGVIYIQGPSGVANFSWTVDGASQGTVTAAATPAQVMRVSASGFGSGTHTVVVTAVGASGAAGTYICGTYGENATGVVVNNFGRSGAQSTVFASASNSFGHPADWSGGASYPCDLLIVELGVNDASTYASGALVTPDTFHANLRAVLEKIKNSGARHGATDVLVLAPHIGLWETEGGAGTALTYHALIARMQEICASYGAAFVNMWANGRNSWDYWNDQSFWGSFATPAASGTDHVHPSDAGHAAVYTALAAALAA